MIEFLSNNWDAIISVLLGLSEILGFTKFGGLLKSLLSLITKRK